MQTIFYNAHGYITINKKKMMVFSDSLVNDSEIFGEKYESSRMMAEKLRASFKVGYSYVDISTAFRRKKSSNCNR